MSWSRIKGIVLQEAYITRRESALWFDLLVLSTVSVLVFGLLSRYLTDHSNPTAATNVLLGMMLWEVLRINQYCVSVNPMWNMWSRNLTNIFVSPLSVMEFIAANCLLALIKTSAVFTVISLTSAAVFHFNILSVGIVTFMCAFIILTLFAWAAGWLLLGLVFRFGTSIQAVTWGAIILVQPISAVFFPVDVIPAPLQVVSYSLPPTYAFEACRNALASGGTDWQLLLSGLALNAVWAAVGIVCFAKLFRTSRVTGQFARNDA